ncbi:replication protein A 70 kDa DNA-binding subunit C-like protein [Tanacetum coccineum]
MSNHFLLIKQLTKSIPQQPIKVRVIRLWRELMYENLNENANYSAVFMDEQGDKIQGCVDNMFLEEDRQFVREGAVLIMTNFSVTENIDTYKLINNQFKIVLHKKTYVEAVDKFIGSLNGFRFVQFHDILDKNITNNQCVGHLIPISFCGCTSHACVDLEYCESEKLKGCDKVQSCILLATVTDISNEGWMYIACLNCNRNVHPIIKESPYHDRGYPVFECLECSANFKCVAPRYRVKVTVFDEHTKTLTFLILFDHQVTQIVGKSAVILLPKHQDNTYADVPKIVSRISDDPALISVFNDIVASHSEKEAKYEIN